MKKWYKVTSAFFDNYNNNYDYEIVIIHDRIDHERDYNYFKTKKEAINYIEKITYFHDVD